MPEADLDSALLQSAGRGSHSALEQLLAQGADVNARTPTGVTALMRAARKGPARAPGLVRLLLEHGADVHAADRMNRSALHAAVEGADPETIRLLRDAGADPDAGDRYGRPPLWHAIQARSLSTVAALLDGGADPNARPGGDWPLLWWAIRKETGGGDPELVRCLLDHNADPNILWSVDWTPLCGAAWEHRLDLVRLLLGYGARLHPVIHGKPTSQPLYFAVLVQDRNLVREFLDLGADPNLTCAAIDHPPLSYAVLQDDPDIVRMLLAAGADPLHRFSTGESILDMAVSEGRSAMAALLQQALASGE